MKASTERKLIRWMHILLSIPILGYIYGPLTENPRAVWMVRFVMVPVVVLSGFWLWKGHLLKRRIKAKRTTPSSSQLRKIE